MQRATCSAVDGCIDRAPSRIGTLPSTVMLKRHCKFVYFLLKPSVVEACVVDLNMRDARSFSMAAFLETTAECLAVSSVTAASSGYGKSILNSIQLPFALDGDDHILHEDAACRPGPLPTSPPIISPVIESMPGHSAIMKTSDDGPSVTHGDAFGSTVG